MRVKLIVDATDWRASERSEEGDVRDGSVRSKASHGGCSVQTRAQGVWKGGGCKAEGRKRQRVLEAVFVNFKLKD